MLPWPTATATFHLREMLSPTSSISPQPPVELMDAVRVRTTPRKRSGAARLNVSSESKGKHASGEKNSLVRERNHKYYIH